MGPSMSIDGVALGDELQDMIIGALQWGRR